MVGESVRVRKPGDARHGQWAHIREIDHGELVDGVYRPRLKLEFEGDGAMSDDYTMGDVIDSDTCLRCGVRLVSSLSRSLHDCSSSA